jgi:hypothetical protein
MWFSIEFPSETLVSGLILDAGASRGDFPQGYRVELSSDGSIWSKVLAEGKGDGSLTEIRFPAVKAKALRVTQTGSSKGSFWSIHELDVLDGAAPAPAPATAAK